MVSSTTSSKCPIRSIGRACCFLFWAAVFGVSYTQAPLYYSNQNQYFLHGLAEGGWGLLDEDWLANTADPTPVFSAVVEFTYRALPEDLFYVYYVLLQGLYFWSLLGIFTVLTGIKPASAAGLCFITFLVALHSGLMRLLSARAFGVDYPWFFQAGVAGQYVLGFGLQPSVFGVLLIASINAFVHEKHWQAAVWAALAGMVHATYLLGAALLVLAYVLQLARAGAVKKGLGVGLLALALVTPLLVYNIAAFAPSRSEDFAVAQNIIAHFRLPHHAQVERWLDGIALAQAGWIVVAMLVVRRTRLFGVMLVVFVISLILTVLQVITGSDTLALLFPWRTSSVLMPVATTIILGALTAGLERWSGQPSKPRQWAVIALCGFALACLTTAGVAIMYRGLGYQTNRDELRLLDFVRSHKKPGDTYLLPVDMPKVGSGKRGVFSTNFTPAPRRGKNAHLIAIDLQRFRLYTGAPIYVDFKAIPYKDADVIEWHRRLTWNQHLYAVRAWRDKKILAELKERGISHVVVSADHGIAIAGLEAIYHDANYKLYRLVKP